MTFTTRLATGVGGALERRFSRRSLLGRTAVIGAAVTVGGLDFVLRPTPAYAAVCGPGASCGDGWTAMCCTISDGVNQCPPGSFAGGWWKADGASLCGGAARYYIDCQGECTHCGCADSPFCTENCWDCERRCASGTCDERRVCWNVFRYGQCNQQVGCSGPVLCRMISCVPPWQFERCTTDAATDDNTTDHTAPCLSPWSPLQSAYAAIGGPGSAVGPEVDTEYAVVGGTAQSATRGRLYRTTATGTTHTVVAAILAVYLAQGGEAAWGLPTTSTTRTADGLGEYNDFAVGASVYSSSVGTWLVSGGIRTEWIDLGRERSTFGYPADVAVGLEDGSWQFFQHGVLATSGYGTYPIVGEVLAAWTAAGPARVGLPRTPQTTSVAGVTTQPFLDGEVCSSLATGTHAVYGPTYQTWVSYGGAAGSYGLPTAGLATASDGSTAQAFQHGTISTGPPLHLQRDPVGPKP